MVWVAEYSMRRWILCGYLFLWVVVCGAKGLHKKKGVAQLVWGAAGGFWRCGAGITGLWETGGCDVAFESPEIKTIGFSWIAWLFVSILAGSVWAVWLSEFNVSLLFNKKRVYYVCWKRCESVTKNSKKLEKSLPKSTRTLPILYPKKYFISPSQKQNTISVFYTKEVCSRHQVLIPLFLNPGHVFAIPTTINILQFRLLIYYTLKVLCFFRNEHFKWFTFHELWNVETPSLYVCTLFLCPAWHDLSISAYSYIPKKTKMKERFPYLFYLPINRKDFFLHFFLF